MLQINISSEEWLTKMLMNENVLITKDIFINYLITVIAGYLKKYTDCEKTMILLPKEVSKLERYTIHKFSIRDQFESHSFDVEDGRVMNITLSKKYIKDLFFEYNFSIVENNVIENKNMVEFILKTEKQILFEYLLEFIEKNLNTEFQQFLKTI